MILARDKRTQRVILTTEGFLSYKRYRLYAVNTGEYPDSVSNCMKYYGSTSVYPLDMYLEVDRLPFKATADAALRIAKIGADSSSYDAAAERIASDFEWTVGSDVIREITDYIGEIVLNDIRLCTEEAMKTYDPKRLRCQKPGRRPKDGFTLYVQMDGAMFNSREGKGKSDSKENPPSGKKTRKKEGSTWKENKLGMVFRSDELIDTGRVDECGNPIMRLGKREYVSTTEGVATFRERLLCIMMKNGLEDASNVVFISDGATWIGKTRNDYIPNAVRILDLYHLKENVMKFGQYIYDNKPELYHPWWQEVCQQLEDGKWEEVLARPEIAVYKEDKDTPNGIVNLHHYIDNNKDAINYPAYRNKGFFVGSGAIESGNKNVLQKRLKLIGMRWYMRTAESLLALRSKLKSDKWESEVVPLVREQYSKWHLNPESIRHKQRKMHINKGNKNVSDECASE